MFINSSFRKQYANDLDLLLTINIDSYRLT